MTLSTCQSAASNDAEQCLNPNKLRVLIRSWYEGCEMLCLGKFAYIDTCKNSRNITFLTTLYFYDHFLKQSQFVIYYMTEKL